MRRVFAIWYPLFVLLILADIQWVKVVEGAALKNGTTNYTCIYVIDNAPAFVTAFNDCKEQLGLVDIPTLDAPVEIIDEYYANITKNGYNDKCFSKCLMVKLQMITVNGTADLKVVEKLYKGRNMTENITKDLLKEWNICNNKIEKDFPGGGDEQKICKKVAAIDHCLFKKSKELEINCD